METKSCKDCVYYIAHYIREKLLFQQLPVNSGHCINKKNGRFRKVDSLCECYMEKDITEEKEQQIIVAAELLKRIARQLESLEAVLKSFVNSEKN